MPFINLIADQRLAIQQRVKQSRFAFMGAVGIATLGVLAFGFLSYKAGSEGARLSELNSEQLKSYPLQQQIAANTSAENDLKPKLQTLQDAQGVTAKWSDILGHLTTQTPGGVWLTNLRSTGTDPTQPVQANFIGDSTSQALISDYVFRLQNCASLSNVTLKFTEEKPTGTSKKTDFEIDAQVVGTTDQKPAAKDKNV